jgi:hypothetical protein
MTDIPKTANKHRAKKGKKVQEVIQQFEQLQTDCDDDSAIELPMAPIALSNEAQVVAQETSEASEASEASEPSEPPQLPIVTTHPAIARINRFLPGGRRFL